VSYESECEGYSSMMGKSRKKEEKIGNAEGKKGMRSPKRGTPRRIERNEVSK